MNELVAMHQAGKQTTIPILYMSGHEAFQFTDNQRAALKQYILDGGSLLGEACCGRDEFADSFRREVVGMFPDRGFDLLEIDHPIYRAYYPYHKDKVHYLLYDGGVKKEFEGPPQL